MYQPNRKFALKIFSVLAVFMLLLGPFSGFMEGAAAQTNEALGSFALTAVSQGGISPDHNNYVQLSWSPPDAVGYSYVIKQSSDAGTTYESRSSNYGKPIKVLNVYPTNGRYLKTWMEEGGTDAPGQGLIQVDEVFYSTFKNDVAGYLKNNTTGYYYDVVMFGSSDNNDSLGDLSATAIAELQKYADTGRGILFGHDVAVTNYKKPAAWPERIGTFGRTLLGMSQTVSLPDASGNPVAGEMQRVYGTKVKAIQDGFLLQYPWKLSPDTIYTVPLSHSNYQHAGATAAGVPHNTIWMQYNNPSNVVAGVLGNPISPIMWPDGSTDNFYLVTYNNAAMIQTGHKSGQSTLDERRILANTLMYLAQYTTTTEAADRSAIDMAKPNLPTAQRTAGNAGRDIEITSKDNGTNYWFKVEATPLAGGATLTSNIVSETITTTLKGYYISEDNDPLGIPLVEKDATGAILTPVTIAAADDTPITHTSSNVGKYIHIQAVDYAGNLSAVQTIEPIKINIAIQAGEEKVYKPAIPGMTAKITTSPAVQITDVQYILVPVADTANYSNTTGFTTKAASINDLEHKGPMHEIGASTGVYTMFNTTDNTLNGIKDNCTLWIMATGTLNGASVTSFEKHTFTNIYTPITIYTTGSIAAGDEDMYGKARVGGLTAKYGVPVDMDGAVLPPASAPVYETLAIAPEIQNPLYTVTPAGYTLTLNELTQNNFTQDFVYAKTAGYWLTTVFSFKDEAGIDLGQTDQTITDFAPSDGAGNGVPFSSPYTPVDIVGYTPVGYVIEAPNPFEPSLVVPASFPGGFADVTIPHDNAVVTIVYKQNAVKVVEQYRTFADAENETTPTKNLFPDNVTGLANPGNFTAPTIPSKTGYVYTGYDVIVGGATIASGRMDRTNPQPPMTPPVWGGSTSITQDTTIVYHYEADSTNTGVPDSLQRQIEVQGVGIDSHGNRVSLYNSADTVIVNQVYTPSPVGSDDGLGNAIVFVDDAGMHWILADSSLNDLSPLTVLANTTLTYFYYKDSGPTGTGDFFEANVTVQFFDENSDEFSNPASYLVTEATSVETFSLEAPHIDGYAPLKVVVKNEETNATSTQTVDPITGYIERLNEDNWTMQFYYDLDGNSNGIPDIIEAKIVIQCVYQYTSGFEEEPAPTTLWGRNGQKMTISPAAYNKSSEMFSFVGVETPTEYTFSHATPMTVRLVYKQNEPVVVPPDSSSSSGASSGLGSSSSSGISSSRGSSSRSGTSSSSAGSSTTGISSESAVLPTPPVTPGQTSPTTSSERAKVPVGYTSTTSRGEASPSSGKSAASQSGASSSGSGISEPEYSQTVETPYAIVGMRYLTKIADEKVPEGYVQVQKTDENGVTYWILEEKAVPLVNSATRDSIAAILILVILLIGLLLLLLWRRRFCLTVEIQDDPSLAQRNFAKLSWTSLGKRYRYSVYRSVDGGETYHKSLDTYAIAETTAEDYSAVDTAKPDTPAAYRIEESHGEHIEMQTEDRGTQYTFKIEAVSEKNGKTRVSNSVQSTVTANLKGYYIVEDNSPIGVPYAGNALGEPAPEITVAAQDNQAVAYTPRSADKYVHIQAVDYAGNVSDTQTVSPLENTDPRKRGD